MLEMTKKLYDEMDELMKVCINKTFTTNMFADMEDDEIKFMQNCFKMYDSAKELAFKQAEIIEEQNAKLDKILRLLEKKSL